MKRKKFRYLSARIRLTAAAALAAAVVFLGIRAAFALREGEHYFLLSAEAAAIAGFAFVWRRWIHRPYLESSRALQLFVTGYTVHGLFEVPTAFDPVIEEAIRKVQDIISNDKLISATRKQAQYLALQNQINPHFLYNTLEGIRGETLNAGLDNVARMTEALARFFRYTISSSDNLVTVGTELANVRNYYIIQRYRFGEKLSLAVEYDEEQDPDILSYYLPKLTLQPIVENAVYHGIEQKMGKGRLRIKIESTPKRLIITVSDNGIGMTAERLREIRDRMGNMTLDYIQPDEEPHGGIAMVNVNNRIRLLFGEEYGICINSTPGVGTDVEITLPLIRKDGKNTYER
jgi:two-component system sensor histidine kinase YesM